MTVSASALIRVFAAEMQQKQKTGRVPDFLWRE
jgi:hypothetical protein